jgi:hypothetical protein
MDALTAAPTPARQPPWTRADQAFLVLAAMVLVVVSWLGVIAHREALKTEGTKRNGESLAAWLTKESSKRFDPGYVHAACKGGPSATASEAPDTSNLTPAEIESATATQSPATWGQCLAYLTTQTELKDMRNPFNGQLPAFVPACDPADHSLVGSIAIDKITQNPPGSAVATINSPLQAKDSIAGKVQLKLAVCDKGSYAIKVAELEF